ncbi:hypothetical protein K491DRAFT_81047 [Lophiostoma macrostomum CBS 122681]|uniref:Uncharacterized protein n=1 Tax=Lophiostoma macrostomum CBS 122681 TaxID=1314788 RepID=A0A6A6TK50_9PLEO|nr:hypothetical protein K491DRAFT_81047 [Lophiostoma macrostomum CBS 122681]
MISVYCAIGTEAVCGTQPCRVTTKRKETGPSTRPAAAILITLSGRCEKYKIDKDEAQNRTQFSGQTKPLTMAWPKAVAARHLFVRCYRRASTARCATSAERLSAGIGSARGGKSTLTCAPSSLSSPFFANPYNIDHAGLFHDGKAKSRWSTSKNIFYDLEHRQKSFSHPY